MKQFLLIIAFFCPASLGATSLPIPEAYGMVNFSAQGDIPTKMLDAPGGFISEEVYGLPLELTPSVLNYLEYFRTGPGRPWLLATLERSRPYREFIFQKLEEKKAPEELFYLAAVESAFVNHAQSWAGAAGMWQFMAGSIDGVKMKITGWVDERMDFWKATESAIEKLQVNQGVLGDWNLALAAYNAGLGRLSSVVKRSGIRNFWEIMEKGLIPRETALYVPQFQALAYLGSRLGREGLPLVWEAADPWEKIELKNPIDLRMLSQAAGLNYSEILNYNRELRYPITPDQTVPYNLKLPKPMAEKVKAVLDDPSVKLLHVYLYTVKKGDMLGVLSQHYGVPMSMILKHNPGTNPDILRLGQVLVIPALKEVAPYVPPKVVSTPAVKVVAAGASGNSAPNYRVKKGDTLWNLAQRVGLAPTELAKANGLNPQGVLRLDQPIYLPPRKAN